MPFKMTAEGAIALDAEKKLPIFVHSDGREAVFDADGTLATISRLNGEAKSHRERAEAAEAKYKPFEGIEDAEAARKALETVKNIKDGELITAGKVQEIKDAANRTAQEQVAAATRDAEAKRVALEEANSKLTQQLNSHIVGGSFSNSKYIQEKLVIPHDVAQAMFASRFKVDDGKLVPLDTNGNPIYSATRHGEIADFEEAISVMVGGYANKDMIMKGSGGAGGGAGGGKPSGDKTMTRAQFAQLPPADQAKAMKDKVTLTD